MTGSLFQFVDWGMFAGGQAFDRFLWVLGAVAFMTGITGTKIGLPAYWAWMSISYLVSAVLTYATLTFVLLAVVTPLAIACRLAGMDRLHGRAGEQAS